MAYLTASDAAERVVAFLGANARGDAQAHAREAVAAAYRKLPTERQWTWYWRFSRLQLHAPYAAGTVTYDHTGGGTCENQLTLAGGTWPDWADGGVLRIGSVHYDVYRRHSNTVLQLDAAVNPGADLTTATAYSLGQDSLLLPADFSGLGEPVYENHYGPIEMMSPAEWLRSVRYSSQTGWPRFYTVMPDDRLPDRFQMRLYPTPDQAATLDFVYYRRPRAVRFYDVTAGTVSLSASSATVTGSGTAFSSAMVGSVLRANESPAAKDPPTGYEGLNPFAFESVITAVASATSLTVADAASAAAAGVRYRVSDPLDVDQAVMRSALAAGAVAFAARFTREPKDRRMADEEYRLELLKAMEADDRAARSRVVGGDRGPWRVPLSDMPWESGV